MPQLASQSSSPPPLPPGYTLDSAGDMPPLPQGYTLDSNRPDFTQNPPGVPDPKNPILEAADEMSRAGMAGVPGGSPNPQPASDKYSAYVGAPIGAAATYMGGATAFPVVLGAAKRHPLVTRMLASEAISRGRQIPYVGKFIPPYSEMLPFLLGGGTGQAAAAEGEAVEEEAPRLIDKMGGKPLETVTEGPSTAAEAYSVGPKPVIQRGPIPGSAADRLETQTLQDSVRAAAEREAQTIESQGKREWFARNQPGSTKGELTGAPDKPVRFTKTPAARLKEQLKSAPVPSASEVDPWERGASEQPKSPSDLFTRGFFSSEPVKDVGAAARKQVQSQRGPLPRGKLIEKMGGKPVESVTGEDLTPILKESLKQAMKKNQ